MKYYLFKVNGEKLSDIFQSSFESVTYKTKREAKAAAEGYVTWTKENDIEEGTYSLYEMNITRIKK